MLAGKPTGKRPLRGPRRRWKDNIRIYIYISTYIHIYLYYISTYIHIYLYYISAYGVSFRPLICGYNSLKSFDNG